jgi:hypothetical protein
MNSASSLLNPYSTILTQNSYLHFPSKVFEVHSTEAHPPFFYGNKSAKVTAEPLARGYQNTEYTS